MRTLISRSTRPRAAALIAPLLIVMVCTASPCAMADDLCPAYAISSRTALDPVAPYLPIMLSVGARPGGSDSDVHITGDEVVVDRQTVGNLIKRPNGVDRTLRSLTIDARRIIVRQSLAFSDAEVRFIAHEIEFDEGGVITLFPTPATSMRLFADRVIFNHPSYRHFDVRMRKRGDDFSDIAMLLQLSTRELRIAGNIIQPAGAAAAIAKRFTLQPLFDFTPKIVTHLDAQGVQDWQAQMKTAAWPAYSVSVWRAGFRVTPFDAAYTARLDPILARYEALLAGLAPASVMFDLRSLRMAIARGVDSDGNGPAFAPVTPLAQLRRTVHEYSQPHQDRLAIVEALKMLVVSARNQMPVQTAGLLAASSDKIKALTAEQRRVRFRLADIANDIDAQQNALGQLTAAYQDRERKLRDHVEDLKRAAASRQQLISGLATAVSIATTAYTGSPQAGALAGGVIIAIGASGSGKNTVESLSAGYDFYNKVKTPLENTKNALRDLDQTRRLYDQFITSFTISNVTIKQFIDVPTAGPPPGTKRITREQALDELGKKGTGVYSGVSDILKVYTDFSPPPATVPPEVEEDADLKSLAAQITDGLEKVKTLTLEMEALQRTSGDQDRRLVEETERSAQLAVVDINNEAERRQLLTLVLSLLRDEVSRFADAIVAVRKVTLLEYREDLPVDPEEIRKMFVSSEVSNGFDPTAVLTESAVLAQYINFIDATETYMQLLAVRVENAMSRQFQSFIARRGTGPALAYIGHTFRGSPFRDTVDGTFLDDVNRLLREQFAARKDPVRWGTLVEQRLRIPLDIRDRASAAYPLRFVQGALVGAGARRLRSANDVTLTLELARVGNFRQRSNNARTPATGVPSPCGCRDNEDCYSVDFRAKESRPDQYFWWRDFSVADIRAGNTLLRTPDLSFWFLDPADPAQIGGRTMSVNYPPAEGEMYIRVRLDPNTREIVAPQFSTITLKIEVFQ